LEAGFLWAGFEAGFLAAGLQKLAAGRPGFGWLVGSWLSGWLSGSWLLRKLGFLVQLP